MAGRGLLQITLKSANDLYKHDLFGKQQPYCQVDCGKYRVKGKTCKDGGQNPTWNETLFFQISNETELLVSLFAEHQLSKDAAIGNAVIPIVQVRQKVTEEVSVPVMLKGKQAGTLHVSLEFKGPTLTTFGQVGQMAPGAADPAASRRALQGRRPNMYGASASFTPGGSSAAAPGQSLRFASLPVRFLQQGGAISGNSFIAAQQQQQQQQQQPGATPFATSMTGSGGISPSSSLVQPLPLGQQQAVDATAEARELLLQRQLSTPMMPADVAALQQMYSQQMQQLQMLQAQLLGNLPPELQQHHQQQYMQLQQQLLAQMTRASSAGSQQDALQQGSGSAVDVTRSGSGGSAALQLPRQPRHTAADLFRPNSSSYTNVFPSSSGTSLQQLLENDRFLEEDSNVASVPFNFDMGRLQAIIAKVYPDSSGVSRASIAALQQRDFASIAAAAAAEPGKAAAAHAAAAAAAPAGPAAGASIQQQKPPPPQQQQQGLSVPPNSIGAFGAAAALAAAAAAGISFDTPAVAASNTNSSSLYGGFGGAAGSAAAAAALGGTRCGSELAGQSVASSSRAASAATGMSVLGSSTSAGEPQLASVQSAGASSATSSKLDRTSQQLLETSPSSTSAQSAPPTTLESSHCEQLTGRDSQPLPAALSAPAAGTLQSMLDHQQQQQQQQQLLLPPDMAAVLTDELNRLRMAAPMLAQLLGLGPMQQQQQDGGAGSTADAAAAAAESSSRVAELERQVANLQREKAYMSTVLQEREQQTQQLYSQISAQQQEINELRVRLSQLEQQQQQRQ